MVLRRSKGKLKFIRVHDTYSKYTANKEELDVEVVVGLVSNPDKAFGFQLRNDSYLATREGMLNLLRDAFKNNLSVIIEHDISPHKKNGIIRRVTLKKDYQQASPRILKLKD